MKDISILLFILFISHSAIGQTKLVPHPEITGKVSVNAPNLLAWPTDFPSKTPDLTEPTSNRIYDLHMQVNNCDAFDLIISTGGNYHMALIDFWYESFLKENELNNWYFTTSPPISPEQTENKALSFSNVALNCKPHVAIGPKVIMERLKTAGLAKGEPILLFTNRGNVMLVKKGNPKQIKSFWDLARTDVKVATPNPDTEKLSFGNYATSLYNIALNASDSDSALNYFNSVFDDNNWVSGKRIHHREVAHLVYTDLADAGLLFHHIARYVQKCFPDEFDIIPMGGTVEDPQPLAGTKIGKFFITRIEGDFSENQRVAREAFIESILAKDFDPYLLKHHINPAER